MSFWPRLFLVLASFTLLSACDLTKSKTTAESGVSNFHQQYNQSEFTRIYTESRYEFKDAAPEDKFMEFIATVRRKMGAFKGATQTSWDSRPSPKGDVVVLTYNSNFEKGGAVESFTFLIIKEEAKLVGYNVNSPILMAR